MAAGETTTSNVVLTLSLTAVQFKKRPYYAEGGYFAAAGSADISYVNALDAPIVSIGGGGQGGGRFFGAASPRLGRGHLLVGLELGVNDGPWVRPDDLGKINGIVRFSRGDTQNGFSVTGMGYSADWNATNQVPVRAIEQGASPDSEASTRPTPVGPTATAAPSMGCGRPAMPSHALPGSSCGTG